MICVGESLWLLLVAFGDPPISTVYVFSCLSSLHQVVTEVVVKNAVPWMEKQLQQLEVGFLALNILLTSFRFSMSSFCSQAQISQTRKACCLMYHDHCNIFRACVICIRLAMPFKIVRRSETGQGFRNQLKYLWRKPREVGASRSETWQSLAKFDSNSCAPIVPGK